MKKLIEEFKKFIKRGNVVDMAVGVAVASAFTAIVNAFTKGFVSPLIALLTGESDIEDLKIILRPEITETVEEQTVVLQTEVALYWGIFVQAIINFFIIALTLFLVMKMVAGFRSRAERISSKMKNALTDEKTKAAAEKEKAEAEAKAKAEEEEKARAEQALKEKEEAKEARLEREEALLTEIRDLLRGRADN